jgi:hypothetical protein
MCAAAAVAAQEQLDFSSMEPEAQAYMRAQLAMHSKLHGPGPAPGAIKAQRQKPGVYFGVGKRSDLNDKLG